MTCQSCVNKIQSVMSSAPGVASISVTLERHSADVTYDPVITTEEDVRARIADLGYTVQLMSHALLQAAGMGLSAILF